MNTDETELIAHIVNGDQEAYRTLVDRYKQDIYRHCFYIVRDEDNAEDMAQEAFIKAYANLQKYDAGKANFKTWLSVIATRQCLSYLRRHKSLPLSDEDVAVSSLAATDQRAKDQELRDAVQQLRPKYRTVVSLYYWQGHPYEQIATLMNAPVGSVRAWLYRAKKELKENLS